MKTKESTTSEDSTAADEIGSDDGTVRTENESPLYTSPSEDSELEYLGSNQGQGFHQKV